MTYSEKICTDKRRGGSLTGRLPNCHSTGNFHKRVVGKTAFRNGYEVKTLSPNPEK
jgi:hypothetical protein